MYRTIVTVGSLLLFLFCAAYAFAHGTHYSPQEIAWMNRQYAVNGSTKCCNEHDVHVGERVAWRMRNGQYEVLVNTNWYQVPQDRLMRYDPQDPLPENFRGQALLFYSMYGANPTIWCFFPENLM